jgi:hypothetical protein
MFGGNFASSIVYAVPWLLMFWVEHIRPQAFIMPAELTAPLMLALMASLIFAGGFVQSIARKGTFFTGLDQRAVAHRMTRRLFECGVVACGAAGAAALVTAWYFDLFAVALLLLAGAFYVTLSLLWMVCALITYEGRRWRIPVVFLIAAIVFVPVYSSSFGTVGGHMAAAYGALIAGALFAARDRLRCDDPLPALLPDIRVILHALTPYFWYGTLYFSLLFADRLVAATARVVTGDDFGIDIGYAHATDVALVSFLLMAAVVEHLNWLFMRFLRQEMGRRTSGDPELRSALLRRHLLYLVIVVLTFPVVDAVCRTLSVSLRPFALGAGGWQVLVIASAGYLFLCLALLNSLILLSLNRVGAVVSSFALALVVDVACGSVFAAAWGVPFAAAGLAVAAAVLAIRTTGQVARVLMSPAYAYCAS